MHENININYLYTFHIPISFENHGIEKLEETSIYTQIESKKKKKDLLNIISKNM